MNRSCNVNMEKYISSNIEELFTEESRKYMNADMINDIKYVMQNPNARKLTLDYGNKILKIEKSKSGGISLQLNVCGKDIVVVSK